MNGRTRLAAALTLSVALLGVAFGDEEPAESRRIPFTTIYTTSRSLFTRAFEKVIATPADYYASLTVLEPSLRPSRVDFVRERAFAVSAGPQGAELEVTSVRRRPNDGKPPVVEITVTEHPRLDERVTRHAQVVTFPHVENASYVVVRAKGDVGDFDSLVVEVVDPKLKSKVDTLTFAKGVFTHEHVDSRGSKTSRRSLSAFEVGALARAIARARLDRVPDVDPTAKGADFVLTLRRTRGDRAQVVRLVPDKTGRDHTDSLVGHLSRLAWPLAGETVEGELAMTVSTYGDILTDDEGYEYDATSSLRNTLSWQSGKRLRFQGERSRGLWGVRGSFFVRAIVVRARVSRSLFSPRVEPGDTLLVVDDYPLSTRVRRPHCWVRRPSQRPAEERLVPLSDLSFHQELGAPTSGVTSGLPR